MPKKLIKVALPLEAINVASARDKSIGHGHPSTLHLWWTRRPLAAARAVIFALMVDDPSACLKDEDEIERDRLLRKQKIEVEEYSAKLLVQLDCVAEHARDFANRLYNSCDRQAWLMKPTTTTPSSSPSLIWRNSPPPPRNLKPLSRLT
jgi:hypothetical protein